MPATQPINAPTSVGARTTMRPPQNSRSLSQMPRKSGKTDVAQTRSAARNSGTTSKRCAAWITAAIMKPIITRRDQFGESLCLSKSCERTDARPFWSVSTDDAASVVSRMSVT